MEWKYKELTGYTWGERKLGYVKVKYCKGYKGHPVSYQHYIPSIIEGTVN